MALTITSDLTVISNGAGGTWVDFGSGGASSDETEYFIQGTGSRSRAVSGSGATKGMGADIGAGNELDFSVAGANEDELVYLWISVYSIGLIDPLSAAPGLRIRLVTGASATTDFNEWDIAYSDLLQPPGTDLFRVYVLDPRAPATRTSGTFNLNSVRLFGAVLDTNATAKGNNIAIDRICHGRGELRVTGTATGPTTGFQEMVDENWGTVNDSVAIGSNSTARNGIIVNRSGINFIKGKLLIGDDTGTLATTFTGQDTTFVWEDTKYYDGTRVRPTVGYDSSGNWTGRDSTGVPYYGLNIVGNGTGATTTTWGALVGTNEGRSGPTFIGSEEIPTEFSFDDGAAEACKIYGSTFDKIRKLDFSSNASTDDAFSNTFKRCGTVDIGPVEWRNNNFIGCRGGAYKFMETFLNTEASGAEALATADPITEWTALLNGADLSVPSADAGYLELLGGTTRTNVVILDDDKMGSNSHYAEMIVNFPSGGATQGTLGPVINSASGSQDYYWMKVDLVNDQVSLIEVNTGTDTTLAGPTAFTMDEDEDYLVHIRHDGTNVEAFISGNSAADGYHTTKLSAVEATHTANRRVGIRGDALAGQTGDAPQMRYFGAGPITDNLGAILCDTAANTDFDKANFINCARALAFDSTGSFSFDDVNISGSLVGAHNDSGGLVSGSFTNAGTPANSELVGASTVSFSADVTLSVHVEDVNGTAIQYAQVYLQKQTPTKFTSGAGNNAGDGDLVVTQTIDSDMPGNGFISVYDVSENESLGYRYASHDGANTFTFPTEVTGAATSTGSGTSLISTSTNFLTADIEEGDTIRNTTDGSWAVVDEIVDADNITTTALRGGTDNTWQNTDAFSVHKLATTLVSGTDTADVPLINKQTDASGNVTKSYNYASDTSIFVRVRSNHEATKYIPFKTSGTIDSGGISVTAVLTEDTEST